MKILVLGSAGQIGKPTCEFLRKKGHEVVEYDIVNDCIQDLRRSPVNLFGTMLGVDFVYYFASDVGGAKYLEKYQDTFEFINNNMKIMSNVFSCLKASGRPFIFTSSTMASLNYSTYGVLKRLGEQMTTDLGGLFVRLWNVYGLETDEEKSHAITDFVNMAKRDGSIRMRTKGEESRQLLYAEDCANALLTLTEQYNNLDKTKNYHITSFEWSTIKEIAQIVSNIHSNCSIIYGDGVDQTQKNAMVEPDRHILQYWTPSTSLRDGIIKVYNNVN